MFDNIKEVQEKKIKKAVEEALSDAEISDLEVEVEVEDGEAVVTISGSVESKRDKKDVLALVAEVEGIDRIKTSITIDEDEDEEEEEEEEEDEDYEDDEEEEEDEDEEDEDGETKKKKGKSYKVQPGDSMWAIAQECLGDGNRWMEIYKLNKELIGKQPELIHPGYVLKLPKV